MTMKLYIQNGSCSLAPQAIANETGLELELITPMFPPGSTVMTRIITG